MPYSQKDLNRVGEIIKYCAGFGDPAKVNPKVIKKEIQRYFECGKTKAWELYRLYTESKPAKTGYKVTSLQDTKDMLEGDLEQSKKIVAKLEKLGLTGEPSVRKLQATKPTKEDDSEEGSDVDVKKDYVYNKATDKYIVFMKTMKRNFVVPGHQHRAMVREYSNWNGSASTINEICRKFSMSRPQFTEYKNIMGWTHDLEPFSTEEVADRETEDMVDEALQNKRMALLQEYQRQDWKKTKEDADNWNKFLTGRVDPFETALTNWKGITCDPIKKTFNKKSDSDRTMVVGLSDLHIGGLAEERYLYKGKKWDIETQKECMNDYADQICSLVLNNVEGFKSCEILGIGDWMQGLRGETTKGTKISCDRILDTQYDAALTLVSVFISRMAMIFPEVNIHIVRGNHDGADLYHLAKTLEAYFRNEQTIKFDIVSSRTLAFRVNDVLLVMDHGASDVYKAAIPRNGKRRESYIQSLLLSKPELLDGAKQKLFIQGDLHHYEQTEFNDFEFVMMGAMPVGDQYADGIGLHSRARQNGLIIGSNGLEAVHHFYFD